MQLSEYQKVILYKNFNSLAFCWSDASSCVWVEPIVIGYGVKAKHQYSQET